MQTSFSCSGQVMFATSVEMKKLGSSQASASPKLFVG